MQTQKNIILAISGAMPSNCLQKIHNPQTLKAQWSSSWETKGYDKLILKMHVWTSRSLLYLDLLYHIAWMSKCMLNNTK